MNQQWLYILSLSAHVCRPVTLTQNKGMFLVPLCPLNQNWNLRAHKQRVSRGRPLRSCQKNTADSFKKSLMGIRNGQVVVPGTQL